ncbi:MAG TPA: TIGR01458 family HAD-type hydrolase [Gemmatimonadales bacterium]|nr:TIGR01458 family HAD-type hydrolase [Gemmatimonadales bacterium]
MPVAAFLFDLEGTLYVGEHAVPGAADTIAALRARGLPFRLVSNTTSRSRAMLVDRLAGFGIAVAPHEVWTAPLAAARLARERGHRRVLALLPRAAHVDLEGLEPSRGAAEAVIVGDLGSQWSYDLLQHAFAALQGGAELIACSRDRYYRKDGGLVLDAGPFVAALEYATRREALVAGKPSASFFRAAVESLGLDGVPPADIVMVGDDLWSDVEGAQRAGCTAWAVATGKFRHEDLATSGIAPARVLASVADLLSDAPAP